jgi:hypothetical protein
LLFIKNIVIHPFLLAIFPIIFLFSQNVNTSPNEIILPVLMVLGAIILIWILINQLLKNKIKSGLMVSTGLVLFFSYGHLFDLLDKNFPSFPIFEKHLILLSIYIITFIIFSTYVIKKNKMFDNITKISNVMSIVIIILPLITIGQFYIIDNPSFIESEDGIRINQIDELDKFPDIYYIIPDAYAGSKALKTILNYDNTSFENFLKEKGFQISDESYSNYESSRFSIPSTLNMKYLNDIYNQTKSVNSMNKELSNISYDTEVLKKFKSKGYTTYVIESGIQSWDTPTTDMKNVDYRLCHTSNALDTEFMSILIQTTIINPVQAQLFAKDHRDKILCGFSELSEMPNKKNTPKFVLVHLMAPHPPYVFGSNGEEILPESLGLKDIDENFNEEFYLGQLEFVNLKMKESIEKLLDTNNPPIIIIQSDHGMKESHSEDEYTKLFASFNNFKAYYFPYEGRNIEFETSTPVNSFRVLFNLYFDDGYELLEDRIYVIDGKEYQFRDITKILRN